MLISSSRTMGSPFFNELKKQASFFFKEKIKNARLALTDVTPVELLTEEATNGSPWAPDAKTMAFISRAAFEIDDYWRIVQILHTRLSKFDRKQWREPYQALVLLEHLITHGPGSTADEFQCDIQVMQQMVHFQLIDERGFNWGLAVRKKAERVLKLLEKGPFLKEERERARKVSRGIEGFGSFNQRFSSENSVVEHFRKWNSHYEPDDEQGTEVDESLKGESKCNDGEANIFPEKEQLLPQREERPEVEFQEVKILAEKEQLLPQREEMPKIEFQEVTILPEKEQLLPRREVRPKVEFQEAEHPFSRIEHQNVESMLLLSQS